MSAQHLFCDLRSMGVELSIDADGRLSFDGPDDVLTDDLLSEMRAHRDGLLVVVESFIERSAIAQYDGGLSRSEAERMALREIVCSTIEPETNFVGPNNSIEKKQIAGPEQAVEPERVEMPIGVICPFCPSRSFFDDADGCRCGGCDRLSWVTLPAGGIVRADFLNVDLWLTASQKAF